MTRALAPVLGLAAAAVLAGCGGGGDHRAHTAAADMGPRQPRAGATSRPEATAPIAPNPATLRVLRGWTDALRHGDVKGASRYFSIPAVVQNDTPPIRLTTRHQVEYFNRALPCGAYLVRVEAAGVYTIGVFRLTERPGQGVCGSGSGNEAAVAFIVAHGRITQWRRLTQVLPKGGPAV